MIGKGGVLASSLNRGLLKHGLTPTSCGMDGTACLPGTRGFVYVATGDLFFREAAESAASLRAANPSARICLIADKIHGEKFWDDLVIAENPSFDFRDKLLMSLCPYEKFIYLDADTYITGELSEVFELLEDFDIIGHQLFEGRDYKCPGVPESFPEFNGGVFGYRRSPAVEKFFSHLLATYLEHRSRNTGGFYDYSNVSEQKAFRITLYRSGLRHSVLGPEYNFIVQHVQFACVKVKILHGRPNSELKRIALIVNAELGPRAWVPILDSCVGQRMTIGGWATVSGTAFVQALRKLAFVVAPAGLRRNLRRSRILRKVFLRNEGPPPTEVEHKRKWGL